MRVPRYRTSGFGSALQFVEPGSPLQWLEWSSGAGHTKSVYIMAHYAKDYKAQRAPESTTVGEPLPQSPRSRPSQPLPDPLAHQLGQKHNRGYGGNRILQGMDPNARKALQPGRS